MNSPNTWDRPDLDYRQPIPQQSEVLGTCEHNGHSSTDGVRIEHKPNEYCVNWKPVGEPSNEWEATRAACGFDAIRKPVAAPEKREKREDGWITEPTEQGWWWHIGETETDSTPFMFSILQSGHYLAKGKMFAAYPDSRWCSDIGGLWAKAIPPAPPEASK